MVTIGINLDEFALVAYTPFYVHGIVKTQGSMRSLGKGRPMIHDNESALKAWRANVGKSALAAGIRRNDEHVPALVLEFLIPRPASHFLRGEVREKYRDATPKFDVDKLQRAVLDGLTGVAYSDDKQVVAVAAMKRFASGLPGATGQGVRVHVYRMRREVR